MTRPPAPIAVTCGDPSGIGPEIIHAAWAALSPNVPFFVLGDPRHFERAPIQIIDAPDEAHHAQNLPLLPHSFGAPAIPGAPSPENAKGVVEVIARAVDLVQSHKASAVTTAPIAKKELRDHAGFTHPGHTEFLAALGGVDHPVMMIASPTLRIVPATIHIPLADVPNALTAQSLERTIRTTHAALASDFGLSNPRIAIAGLNPHAGEGGMLGAEDNALIRPVIEKLQAAGMDLTGPLPADTMFHASARATYDAAIAMYHDQALIPAKTLAFDEGVNVTLGLPFIRTSPDHGTAFDIAGQGIARPTSMIEALKLVWSMAKARAA